MRPAPDDGAQTNPFYVLEVRPGASGAEIERAGQKLLAMLAVGLEAAATYPTPTGPRQRDADLVRQALDAVRDPARRWIAELFATLPPDPLALDPEPPPDPWPEALDALGRPGDPRSSAR